MNLEKPEPDHACDTCGSFDAFPMSDRWLCEQCYSTSGAGCAGGCEDEPAAPAPGTDPHKTGLPPATEGRIIQPVQSNGSNLTTT
jgi:hypothetical protein